MSCGRLRLMYFGYCTWESLISNWDMMIADLCYVLRRGSSAHINNKDSI